MSMVSLQGLRKTRRRYRHADCPRSRFKSGPRSALRSARIRRRLGLVREGVKDLRDSSPHLNAAEPERCRMPLPVRARMPRGICPPGIFGGGEKCVGDGLLSSRTTSPPPDDEGTLRCWLALFRKDVRPDRMPGDERTRGS